MTDMIERAGRAALCGWHNVPRDNATMAAEWERMGPATREAWMRAMRAAIEAMRGDVVPVFEDISNMDREWKQSRLTADMLNAGECAAWCNGGRPFGYNGVLNIWRAMIDAALNPPSESK